MTIYGHKKKPIKFMSCIRSSSSVLTNNNDCFSCCKYGDNI